MKVKKEVFEQYSAIQVEKYFRENFMQKVSIIFQNSFNSLNLAILWTHFLVFMFFLSEEEAHNKPINLDLFEDT